MVEIVSYFVSSRAPSVISPVIPVLANVSNVDRKSCFPRIDIILLILALYLVICLLIDRLGLGSLETSEFLHRLVVKDMTEHTANCDCDEGTDDTSLSSVVVDLTTTDSDDEFIAAARTPSPVPPSPKVAEALPPVYNPSPNSVPGHTLIIDAASGQKYWVPSEGTPIDGPVIITKGIHVGIFASM